MSTAKCILYVGQLWRGSTSYDRMLALRELGCSVLEFDTSEYMKSRSRLGNVLAHRLNWGRPITELNRDLRKFGESNALEQITHIWVDKGKWIHPDTLYELRSQTEATLIHYTLDPQLVSNRSRQFSRSIPLYDVLFTTKPFELDEYKRSGARCIHLVDQAYDSRRFYPRQLSLQERTQFGSDVCFVGHQEEHYNHCITAARKAGCSIRVWGPGWAKHGKVDRHDNRCVFGEALWGETYPVALNAANIALGLLTKRYGETTTTRTFEIPACGTFMLAERTDDHLRLFDEGKEAEFFSCEEELIDKIRYFLAHSKQRSEIASAGYQRCLKSGYSNLHRMRQALDIIDGSAGACVRDRRSVGEMRSACSP